MTSTERFIVIKASAGSGKTYTLVRHYLKLALGHKDEAMYFRNILAITFTTAAAGEMKHRVMLRLSEIAADKGDASLMKDLCSDLQIDSVELKRRATDTYNRMLHHYRDISIMTIDSFTHRLIRSFAKDLQLKSDFNIKTDASLFKEQIIERLMDDIGKDRLLTQYIKQYVVSNLDDGSGWNPNRSLKEIADFLFKEESQLPLQKLSNLTLEDFSNVQHELKQSRKAFEIEVSRRAAAAIELLVEVDITEDDLNGKSRSFLKDLKILASGKIKSPLSNNYHKALDNDMWLPKTTGASKKAAFHSIQQALRGHMEYLKEMTEGKPFKDYSTRGEIAKNIILVGLIDRMQDCANGIREDENILMLSDFHRLVYEIVRENDAPFIYERIGNRYRHILIDEFQDTSKIQWLNLIPLVQNSLAEGHTNLIVGDAKQSIYRWRASFVDQFIKLPDLPSDFMLPLVSKTFNENIKHEFLETNFRSSESVIEFNNRVYNRMAASIPQYGEVYEGMKQHFHKTHEGYVKVITAPKHIERKELKPHCQKQLLDCISECVADGFHFGDITILVRSGNDSATLANYLNEHQIRSTTSESFFLKRSLCVRALMGYLEFSEFPLHHFAAFDCAEALCQLHPHLSIEDFIAHYMMKEGKRKIIKLKEFLELHFGNFTDELEHDSVFNLTMSIIRALRIPADSGIEFLLNHIKQQCIQQNMDLSQFIQWWRDSKNKLAINSAAHSQAVNIMTIHKSKGLEFPVVIYYARQTSNAGNQIWIEPDSSLTSLPAALVKVNKPKQNEQSWDDEEEEPSSQYKTEEQQKMILDEANVFYVATTRAEQRLYIILESKSGYVHKLFYETVCTEFPEFASEDVCSLGARTPALHRKIKENPKPVNFNMGEALLPQLKIITPKMRDTPQMAYGKLLHEALSLINEKVDAGAAVELTLRGRKKIDPVKDQQLLDDALKIAKHPKLQPWFSGEGILISEREICNNQGEIMRPDRVVELPGHVAVIDYKSGVPSSRHLAQIGQYKAVLERIYHKPVKGFLVYTQSMTIQEV